MEEEQKVKRVKKGLSPAILVWLIILCVALFAGLNLFIFYLIFFRLVLTSILISLKYNEDKVFKNKYLFILTFVHFI